MEELSLLVIELLIGFLVDSCYVALDGYLKAQCWFIQTDLVTMSRLIKYDV